MDPDDKFEHFEHFGGYGHMAGGGYEMFPLLLRTALLVGMLILLAWALLRWIIPYIRPYILPKIADIFGVERANPPALEILRQRYAAGEIDAITFEQMRERLEASYLQESFYQQEPPYQQMEQRYPF